MQKKIDLARSPLNRIKSRPRLGPSLVATADLMLAHIRGEIELNSYTLPRDPRPPDRRVLLKA